VMAKAESAFVREQKLEDTTLGWRMVNPAMAALHGVDAMSQTAENLAREHGISRLDQDAFALRSQQRAEQARQAGRFDAERMAVGKLDADEQPRPDTSAVRLATLAPLLGPEGTITAGNASGLNDGACALLLASESAVERWGLTPRARVLGLAAAGVPPRIMGIGPVPAIAKLLARLKHRLDDYDRIEINEAFAAQVLAVTRSLGLADDSTRVNPDGGAIALGHPLGASGARLALTAANGLARGDSRLALVTMCVGVGQGVALALERQS